MSQPFPSISLPHFAPRAGRVAASALLVGAVMLSAPAHAQVLGGMGQRSSRNSNAPQQTPVQLPQVTVQRSSPQQNYPQQSYPQQSRSLPTMTPNAPIFQGRVYSSNSGDAPVLPSTQSNEPNLQPLPPSISYRTREIMPGVRDSRQYSYSNQSNGDNGRAELPQLHGTVGQRGFENGNAPVLNSLGNFQGERSIRITTPVGARPLPPQTYNNYIYQPVTVVGGPTLLGGYYYGNYCDGYYANYSYPSLYGCYDGFPQYISSPNVVILSEPYCPVYATPYLPFFTPTYQVTYNQTNYYVGSQERVQQIEDGGDSARQALKKAYPAGSFQAAFGDIEKAWTNSDIVLIRNHTRDQDTKLSVFFKGKYSYSIASKDFVQITRDALDRLNTVSFEFTRLRKAKNGDVTAYGKHVYRTADSTDTGQGQAGASDTVPFSTDDSQDGQPYAKGDDPASGQEKTIYVSYTLRHHDDQWYIVAVNSSPTDIVK